MYSMVYNTVYHIVHDMLYHLVFHAGPHGIPYGVPYGTHISVPLYTATIPSARESTACAHLFLRIGGNETSLISKVGNTNNVRKQKFPVRQSYIGNPLY